MFHSPVCWSLILQSELFYEASYNKTTLTITFPFTDFIFISVTSVIYLATIYNDEQHRLFCLLFLILISVFSKERTKMDLKSISMVSHFYLLLYFPKYHLMFIILCHLYSKPVKQMISINLFSSEENEAQRDR